MRVIPKQGLLIPDPQRGDFLPETGRNVTSDTYWKRRIKQGDVSVEAAENEPTTQKRGSK